VRVLVRILLSRGDEAEPLAASFRLRTLPIANDEAEIPL
jgi:hypothetical protein